MKRGILKSIILIAISVLSVLIFSESYKALIKAFYPIKYKEIVLKYSEYNGIDPNLVFAVIKNESGFNNEAVSSLGARGLMQITEETFQWLKTKIEPNGDLHFNDMFDPELNIKFGCFLLKLAYEEFDSESAIYSAYHAGFNITRQWLNNKNYSSDGINLQKVPYEDTNRYVINVKKTLKIYKKLYGGKL